MEWAETVRAAGILIIDDDPSVVRLLEAMLRRAGYERIATTSEAAMALPLFQSFAPDLVLLDLHMPGVDGLELMEAIYEQIPPKEYLPTIVITGDASDETRLRALLLGARDFITKPIDVVETMLRIRLRLETRFQFLELQRENEELRRAHALGGAQGWGEA